MKKIMKKIGKWAPLAAIMGILLMPYASAASGDIDIHEGTVLAASVFFFLVGAAIIFWILPQKKEKKITAWLIGIGIAIAVMAILFYFTEYLTGWNIAFWTEWITYTGNETAFAVAMALDFLILLVGGYATYIEKNPKKERDIIGITILALIICSIIVLLPALPL